MDRPNTELAVIVESALRMEYKPEAVAYLVQHQVADRVIARLLSERAEVGQQRGRATTS